MMDPHISIYLSVAVTGNLEVPDMGSITCKCNQLQLLLNFMITDYNYNYFFLNVIDYNYRLHCKVIMITL